MNDSTKITLNDSIRVFGSAVLRVAPDTASIVVAVTRLDPKPDPAYASSRKGAQAVTAFLHKAGIKDFGSSRISLEQKFNYKNGENVFVGYLACIEFNVVVYEMDKVDSVVCGLIGAGANELRSVSFETIRLKQLRADARRRAVKAAREKAELYCDAAGVKLGSVRVIEDVSPESLGGGREGHTYREAPAIDDAGEPGPIDPKAIAVGAAVYITYGFA